jgi:hypothetical protein
MRARCCDNTLVAASGASQIINASIHTPQLILDSAPMRPLIFATVGGGY